jgi:hypothetical protein
MVAAKVIDMIVKTDTAEYEYFWIYMYAKINSEHHHR